MISGRSRETTYEASENRNRGNTPSVTAAPPRTCRRSKTRTCRPARARYAAATSPLCPPPTMTASYRMCGRTLPPRRDGSLDGRRARPSGSRLPKSIFAAVATRTESDESGHSTRAALDRARARPQGKGGVRRVRGFERARLGGTRGEGTMRRHIPILGAFTALIVASAVPMAVAGHSTFAPGDLFVGVGGGKVQWRHPDTTLNRVLSTSTSSPQTTGMALDPAHRLYSTGYTSNSINLFDPTGAAAGTFGAGFNSHPESIAFDTFGNAYVGQEGGSRDILKLGPTGSLLAAYNAATEVKGTDRLDVAGDQCTVLYTSQGTAVKRFNACSNTQLSDLATGLPGTAAFDVKALLTGGVLVADSQTIVRLDASGSIVQQYDPDPAQNNCWTALTLG